MAHGDNHAKQIVIEEATDLANKLQNGSAGDPVMQGKAIGHIVKMITPLYEAEFVTVAECERKHLKRDSQVTELKVGPFAIKGHLTTALLMNCVPLACCAMLLYVLAKAKNWM